LRIASRGVGDIEDLDEEDQEIFYTTGIGNRRIARTKAEVVQRYFSDSDSDSMRMWSEDLDSK
jgi:hypothetical protein